MHQNPEQEIQKHKPQRLRLLGLPYLRLIAKNPQTDSVQKAALRYAYVVVYSYRKLRLIGFSKEEQTISTIDLDEPLEKIFARLRKDAKEGIRKSEKTKNLTFKIPDKNRRSSYAFYRTMKRYEGITPDARREFAGCLFLNAYLNGELIVSRSYYDAGEILRAKHTVSTRKLKPKTSKMVGHATRRLIWESIRYGKKHGYKTLDLAGVNLRDPSKKGIADFKLSFGGDTRTIWIYRRESTSFKIARAVLRFLFKKNIH